MFQTNTPLVPGRTYTVGALSIDLDEFKDIWACIYEANNEPVPQPFIYRIRDFEVVDSSIPSDWKVASYSMPDISSPTLICGPDFIANNIRLFVDLHDASLDCKDRYKIINYFSSLDR